MVQNTKPLKPGNTKKNTKKKNDKIPHPGLSPKNDRKNDRKKYGHFRSFLVIFFVFLGLKPGMGDFVMFFGFFFVFPGLRGFCILYHPREIPSLSPDCDRTLLGIFL